MQGTLWLANAIRLLHIHRAFRISHSILVAELTSLRTALAPTLASPVAGVS
jgi:hypothetical protein